MNILKTYFPDSTSLQLSFAICSLLPTTRRNRTGNLDRPLDQTMANYNSILERPLTNYWVSLVRWIVGYNQNWISNNYYKRFTGNLLRSKFWNWISVFFLQIISITSKSHIKLQITSWNCMAFTAELLKNNNFNSCQIVKKLKSGQIELLVV